MIVRSNRQKLLYEIKQTLILKSSHEIMEINKETHPMRPNKLYDRESTLIPFVIIFTQSYRYCLL